ncbi:hypothetical protein L218DRAFT_1082378 [Marasmius fiardii PR-910]|nr:hypothetical protein L218DRAFT_1082378 [Marasmius fiardii PR-910]
MAISLPALRIALYFALSLFSITLLGLCAARIHYTTNLPRGDPLNGGVDFHDPIVAELLATSIFVTLWSWFVIHAIHKRRENRFISTFRGELIGSFILWIMLLVGAAIATTTSNPPLRAKWGNLSSCNAGFVQCRVLTALIAFAWINWIVLTILIVIAIGIAAANHGWNEPMHGRWDPRGSVYRDSRAGPQMSTRPTSYA